MGIMEWRLFFPYTALKRRDVNSSSFEFTAILNKGYLGLQRNTKRFYEKEAQDTMLGTIVGLRFSGKWRGVQLIIGNDLRNSPGFTITVIRSPSYL